VNVEQVARLAAAVESETLEFKTSTGSRREAAQTDCAMLNRDGGRVLFGITPEGRVVGQQVSEHSIEKPCAELVRIDPSATPSVERVHVADDRYVVAVSVRTGSARPYQCRGVAWR